MTPWLQRVLNRRRAALCALGASREAPKRKNSFYRLEEKETFLKEFFQVVVADNFPKLW